MLLQTSLSANHNKLPYALGSQSRFVAARQIFEARHLRRLLQNGSEPSEIAPVAHSLQGDPWTRLALA